MDTRSERLYDAIELAVAGLIDPREIVSKANPDTPDLGTISSPARTLRQFGSGQSLTSIARGNKRKAKLQQVTSSKMIKPIFNMLSKSEIPLPAGVRRGVVARIGSQLDQNRGIRITKQRNLRAAKALNKPKVMRDAQLAGAQRMRNFGLAALPAGAAGGVLYGKSRPQPQQEPVIKSLQWDGQITEVDAEKRHVFGFATVTHINGEEVIDKQGDYIPIEEIEKAAYNYVLHSRKGGDMHERDGDGPRHTADLIESIVFNSEKAEAMGYKDAPKHGWWVGFKVNDDQQWNDVKSGERRDFSIHGSGRRADRVETA